MLQQRKSLQLDGAQPVGATMGAQHRALPDELDRPLRSEIADTFNTQRCSTH